MTPSLFEFYSGNYQPLREIKDNLVCVNKEQSLAVDMWYKLYWINLVSYTPYT